MKLTHNPVTGKPDLYTPTTGQIKFTREGGYAIRLTNKTGAVSVRGTLVKSSDSTDNAFEITDANCVNIIGVVYQNDAADGEECYIVITGIAEVLLKDTTAATRGYWVSSSSTAGRADATSSGPPGADPSHFQEIGHCIESKGAGTNVLAKCVIHFN